MCPDAYDHGRTQSGHSSPNAAENPSYAGSQVSRTGEKALGRLLVLDDEPDFSLFVASVAREIGYSVLISDSGDAFKQDYGDFTPDVVSIDMIMPDIDGVQLLEFLAKKGCRAEIIIISGFTPFYLHCARELSSGLGLKAPTLMSKPVHLKDLRQALLDAADKAK